MTRRDETRRLVVMLSWWRDSDAAGGAAMVKRERGLSSEEGRQRIATARETMQFRPAPLAAPNLPFLGCNVHATHASTRHSTTRRRVFQWRIDSVTEMTRSRVRVPICLASSRAIFANIAVTRLKGTRIPFAFQLENRCDGFLSRSISRFFL